MFWDSGTVAAFRPVHQAAEGIVLDAVTAWKMHTVDVCACITNIRLLSSSNLGCCMEISILLTFELWLQAHGWVATVGLGFLIPFGILTVKLGKSTAAWRYMFCSHVVVQVGETSLNTLSSL